MTSLGGHYITPSSSKPQSNQPLVRRQPSTSSTSSTISEMSMSATRLPSLSGHSPRVQLVPHARTFSFDTTLSDTERQAVDNTNFDARDLSSQDFDFEDIFTYDKPQQELARVIEVSTHKREQELSTFSFSHYVSPNSVRSKTNKHRSAIGGVYTRNSREAKKK